MPLLAIALHPQATTHPDHTKVGQIVTTEPTRIQRRRTRGWTLARAADPFRGGVIVSRPSRYGNPCKVGLMREMGYEDPHAAAAGNFRTWLAGSRSDAPTDEADRRRARILAGLPDLRGKDLACTCRLDQACHADYLLRLANMPVADQGLWVAQVLARVDRQRVRDGEEPLLPASHPAPDVSTVPHP